MNIMGMSEQWVTARIQEKCEGKCIPWENLRDLVLTHLDAKKKVDVLALCIYSLVIFPKALRHVDEAVTDLFDRLGRGVTPVPEILAEIYSSLKEIVATPKREDMFEESWKTLLQNLKEEDIE
ncbi:UDP-glycosyltransferase 91C1-like [Gossypium australe]|uniref:UDP-glycosyltransferase 91C1-like n=1 Tax=Gossypium australe TaxID=47621 RepID=A0A5B6WH34_9ROSI|nr:UDP-glycosyltransferase 91C1-like [Gossypium australe]